VVIPSYWGLPEESLQLEDEIIFDHPTPLDKEGTLGRLLGSLKLIDTNEFKIVIIAAATTPLITSGLITKLEEIIRPYSARYDITLLHSQNLNRLRRKLIKEGVSASACRLISLESYPAVRNVCSLAGLLNGSEITIFLDDDEVITDSEFLRKAQQFIGTKYQDCPVRAVAGFYLQPNSYRLDVDKVPVWRKSYWDNAVAMNEAFELVIGRPPRLELTPFVFGGNMVVHRDILREVPFDPLIRRGEDIDFLINCRIHRMNFWLDRELYVKHLPPNSSRPAWKSLREDMKRFLYERKKVTDHKRIKGVSYEELMPYPGMFLGPDLEERIIRTNELLMEEYKKLSDEQGIRECQANIELAKNNPFKDVDTCAWLRNLTEKWKELTKKTFARGIPD